MDNVGAEARPVTGNIVAPPTTTPAPTTPDDEDDDVEKCMAATFAWLEDILLALGCDARRGNAFGSPTVDDGILDWSLCCVPPCVVGVPVRE